MKDNQRRAMFAKLRKGEFRRLQGTTGYETNPIIVSGTLANLNKYRRLGYTILWSGENKMAFVREAKPSYRKSKTSTKTKKSVLRPGSAYLKQIRSGARGMY